MSTPKSTRDLAVRAMAVHEALGPLLAEAIALKAEWEAMEGAYKGMDLAGPAAYLAGAAKEAGNTAARLDDALTAAQRLVNAAWSATMA